MCSPTNLCEVKVTLRFRIIKIYRYNYLSNTHLLSFCNKKSKINLYLAISNLHIYFCLQISILNIECFDKFYDIMGKSFTIKSFTIKIFALSEDRTHNLRITKS